jgi:hypothetical protein
MGNELSSLKFADKNNVCVIESIWKNSRDKNGLDELRNGIT